MEFSAPFFLYVVFILFGIKCNKSTVVVIVLEDNHKTLVAILTNYWLVAFVVYILEK